MTTHRQLLAATLIVAAGALGATGATAQDRKSSAECPTVGGVLKFARTADVSDWY